MTVLAFIGRLAVGLFFVQSAIQHFAGAKPMARYAAAKGVPAPTFSGSSAAS